MLKNKLIRKLYNKFCVCSLQVNTKGENAINLAEKTNASITSISFLVNETTRCFQDATSDTNQAEALTQNALQLVNKAANVSRLSDWCVYRYAGCFDEYIESSVLLQL